MTLRHKHFRDCITGLTWYQLNNFPHFEEIDPFQLIYMCYHSMDFQNMRVREICIVNLPLTFSILIETKFSSFSIFFSSSHNEKWKYYITNRSSLTFMVFIEVHNLKACNFIKKRLQHKCFPVKFAKSLRAPPILKNIYERLLLIFLILIHDIYY